jgi:phosphoglycolate phosphatase-like HAD superfamily hydrolase
MTDRAIFRDGLRAISSPVTPEAVDALLEAYLVVLAAEMALATTPRIHAGILPALDAAAHAKCAIGLGTGNVHAGARIKLERVGIYHRFDFGGFGSDHEIRAEILRHGAARGAEWLGAPLATCRVVVIGDTPKDIAAAREIGAECIAVATGTFRLEDLRAHRPDHAFNDLGDAGALGALLHGRLDAPHPDASGQD